MLHLLIELHGCDVDRLCDSDLLDEMLHAYLIMNDMQLIKGPFLYDICDVEGSDPVRDGFSGMVLLSSGHVNIHTLPHRGEVYIDIFPCKAFDQEKAVAYASEKFQTEDVEIHLVERGIHGSGSVTPEVP